MEETTKITAENENAQLTVETPQESGKETRKKPKLWRIVLCVVLVIGALAMWYLFFASFSTKSEPAYIYIDTDDNIDSVRTKLAEAAEPSQMMGFNILASITSYGSKIRTGRYEISPSKSTYNLIRSMKNGEQSPIMLTIPTAWTKEIMAARIAPKLMTDSASLASAMNDMALCKTYGMDTNTITTIFIPNTYEVYWNITPEQFIQRMYKEYQNFWNKDRTTRAEAMGLTKTEVVTLASIVDGETANNGEKPMIAGLYLNRLHKGMLLQSDPTVKYALHNFALRRIYNDMLRTPSPYNTYVTKGLPPSPIRIPVVSSIDAVLNYVKHDYIFMCAKEDFSGTHNFAVTYAEHQANARKYVNALNARGVK